MNQSWIKMAATYNTSAGDTVNFNVDSSSIIDWRISEPVQINRELLDKNGNYKPSPWDYTWAGASTLGTMSFNVPSWSPVMKKKFTPKTVKRRGWRD